VKNSYCVGSKGIEVNGRTNLVTGNIELQQNRRLLDSNLEADNSRSSNLSKRSDIYGENVDLPTELDQDKLQKAILAMKDKQAKDDITNENSKKKGGYNSMKGVEVSIEDMEAYRMTKSRRDDPMEKFLE